MKHVIRTIVLMLVLMVGVTFTASAEADAASNQPSKVTISSAKSVDYNAVKVTWKKTKNAKTYQVYRATSKNGKYKKVATTSYTSYTNKKLTTGKKYYYKVRAFNGKIKGSFSSVKAATPKLKTPSVSVSASTTSVKMSWNKVIGAKGYQVYRATSKSGKYTKVKTTSSTSWTNSKLTSGKTYYYKVRAYRKSGSKTLYSSYKSFSTKTKVKHVHDWDGGYYYDKGECLAAYYVCNSCGEYEPSGEHLVWGDCAGSTHLDYIYEINHAVEYKCSCGAKKEMDNNTDSNPPIKVICAAPGGVCYKYDWIPDADEVAERIKKDNVAGWSEERIDEEIEEYKAWIEKHPEAYEVLRRNIYAK